MPSPPAASSEPAAYTPDGRWLAYASGATATGRSEIFIRPFPAGDALYTVSSDGGGDPDWSHSGRELFFRSAEGDLMAVDVRAGEQLQLSAPRVVTRRTRDFADGYEVFPDDKSFLFVEREGNNSQFVLVLNFFEELRRLAPN